MTPPSITERKLGFAAPWSPAIALTAVAILLGLTGPALFPGSAGRFLPTAGAFFLLALCAGALALRISPSRAKIPVVFSWHPGIWAQPAAQGLVIVYMSLYCPEFGGRGPTIALQLLFAAAVDTLNNWRVRGKLLCTASIVPIVCSINLFLMHDDAHLWLDLAVVAVAVLSKSLWRWKDTRYGHIFNPSAIALSIAGVIYYSIGRQHWHFIRLDEIFLLAPNTSEIILVAGLFVQLMFTTGPTTLAGIFAMMFWGITLPRLGIYHAPSPLEAQGFIGLTLLMTDPATSPRSLWGRVIFGAAWGSLYVGTQVLLSYTLGFQYVYFGKIFAVPMANLLTPSIDRFVERRSGGRPLTVFSPAARSWKYATTIGIWLVFVTFWSSSWKQYSFEEPGRAEFKILHAPPFQKTAADGVRVLCTDNPAYCKPFSFRDEYEFWSARNSR